MKKIFTLIVMALVGLACGMQASAEAYTVYFYNPTDLPTPHVHVWGNSVSCNFPGYEMTWDENIGLWKLSLDAVPTNFLIAFCENGELNNKYSVVDLGAFDDIDRTLYFQNTLNLPSINMYASTKYGIGDDQTAEKSWTGDWPGIQVPTEQVEGDLYKVTFKAYFQPNTIVFSNNSNDKTEDMGFLNNGVASNWNSTSSPSTTVKQPNGLATGPVRLSPRPTGGAYTPIPSPATSNPQGSLSVKMVLIIHTRESTLLSKMVTCIMEVESLAILNM